MPTAYRIELSPNNRAGCKDTECKNNGVKILKGECRLATLIEIQEKQSWAYKHWSCVSPKVISNMQVHCQGDLSLIEGYEEMPDEWQDKIARALEQGHIDDEDYKGDPQYNRPGAKKPRTPKAKKTKDEDNDDNEAGEDGPESPTKPAPKKRGRPKAEPTDEEAEAPAPKKSRGRPKKAAAEDAEDEEEKPKPKRASRAKKSKASQADVADEEEDEAADEPEPPKAKRGRKKKDAEDANGDEDKAPAPKAKGKKTTGAASASNGAKASKEMPEGAPDALDGLTFVVTGVIDSYTRKEAEAVIKQFGGKTASGISKKVDYIVLGTDAGPKKLEMIAKDNLSTLDWDGLLQLIKDHS
ncbi:hypothetical protein H2201_001769 [Coniosporium apollinis]|uniref:PARP-type domain-containing protein n=1 Tax=Coniosporium apollinis TaxID=61459 RepID=A0ABQ9P038_9PEZI|nr:hypothetical protein H2201_001769 [Coniosporium apollinis]